jgi:hypothetical protein
VANTVPIPIATAVQNNALAAPRMRFSDGSGGSWGMSVGSGATIFLRTVAILFLRHLKPDSGVSETPKGKQTGRDDGQQYMATSLLLLSRHRFLPFGW